MFWGLLPIMLLCNCTVLEERDSCPNYLSVDFRDVDKGIKEWQMWFFNAEGGLVFKDTVSRSSYSGPYIVEVPRYATMRCILWGNIRSATNLDENYSYKTNFVKKADVSADSIYFFTDTIDTRGETSFVKIAPNKEFATVDIFMKGWIGSDYEVDMVLECANSGFYVDKGFVDGAISTNVGEYDIGNYFTQFRCRMLRQKDTENILLRLRVKGVSGNGSDLEEKVIPLGEYLEENGYDMQADSLEDIAMEVDFSYNNCVVKVADWEATYKIDKEI